MNGELAVRCGFCGAEPSEECREPGETAGRAAGFHRARIDAASRAAFSPIARTAAAGAAKQLAVLIRHALADGCDAETHRGLVEASALCQKIQQGVTRTTRSAAP